jgi:pentatricopeptide repeat protein
MSAPFAVATACVGATTSYRLVATIDSSPTLCFARSVAGLQAVFNAMEPSGVPPNVIHYTALLTALEAGGHWTRALDVYNQMKARGVGVTLHTISTILSVCAKGHMVDQAVAIFHEAKAAGIRGDVFTYSALISVFAEAGDAPQALQAFHEMQVRARA